MARKRYKPEEIVSLLRQSEVLHGQGMSMADALRQLGISEVTFYRWRKESAAATRGRSGGSDARCSAEQPPVDEQQTQADSHGAGEFVREYRLGEEQVPEQ